MKSTWIILTVWLFLLHLYSNAQQTSPVAEEKLENGIDEENEEQVDDHYLQEIERLKKTPVNLNTAGTDRLGQLGILNDLQIENLVRYRELFGSFLHIYELQAIPSWDPAMIRKLLPFVTIEKSVVLSLEMPPRFREGEHSLLFRLSQVLESATGFTGTTTASKYLGSRPAVLFRYRYIYKDLLQFGILGDKDAGEPFFKGKQHKGFDFYSFHFYVGNFGIVKSLVAGDFTVNLGQGLVQWQGLAFRKSVEVMSIKRQSPILRSYTGAGEFYFFRGAGLTVQKRKIESTIFASLRKLGANLSGDTIENKEFISSFLTSGNHRTQGENETRNNISQLTSGFNAGYRDKKWSIGLNGIYYHFSKKIRKRAEPYNRYSISGSDWYNASIDYSYTFRNLHFFGEIATDRKFHKAFLHGLLISVDHKIDLSFLHRSIHPAYQAINGNSFTENSFPTNERGFYTGIRIRPRPGWSIDAYVDFFHFPWLKYRVDAPSHGSGYLIQLTYTPSKQFEIYTRYRNEKKQVNGTGAGQATHALVEIPRQNWRTHINYKIDRSITLRNRVELVWYDRGSNQQEGFLVYADFLYKPMISPFSLVGRLQYFESDGYDSRIYAYENDVLYNYSVPSFNNKGVRGYLVLHYDFSKKITCWVRYAIVLYNNIDHVGTGPDEIPGNRKTELKLQARVLFSP